MSLSQLKELVDQQYTSLGPDADPWTPWAYVNHVQVVADKTQELAEKYNADVDLAVAGALVHDIADSVTTRKDPEHERKSLDIARTLLQKAGYTVDDTTFVVDEILRPHSCKEILPTTVEGKVMATADSMAHFLTDFYTHFCWQHYGPGGYDDLRKWIPVKLEKDFNRKIFFEDEREEVRPNYEAIKRVFSIGL